MSLKSTKINNAEIILPTLDIIDKKWKGKKILDLQYWVMAILSKRRSGKTTLIYNLIKQFCNKNTIVLFFCPTFHKDSTYGAIKKYLDEREINYEIFSHFIEDGCNHIDEFLDANNKPAQNEESIPEEKEAIPTQVCNFQKLNETQTISKKQKMKKIEPEYMVIFDDLSIALRHQSVNKLVKNSRHYKCKIVLSSQSITDLHPSCFSQLDYVALFKNLNQDSLEKVYLKLEPHIKFEEFVNLYHSITDDSYNFMIYDRANEQYRKNLNTLIKM